MPPVLTYCLLALMAALFVFSLALDMIRLPGRWVTLRRFSTAISVVSILGAYLVIRPGRGNDAGTVLLAGRTESRPVFVDFYSNT